MENSIFLLGEKATSMELKDCASNIQLSKLIIGSQIPQVKGEDLHFGPDIEDFEADSRVRVGNQISIEPENRAEQMDAPIADAELAEREPSPNTPRVRENNLHSGNPAEPFPPKSIELEKAQIDAPRTENEIINEQPNKEEGKMGEPSLDCVGHPAPVPRRIGPIHASMGAPRTNIKMVRVEPNPGALAVREAHLDSEIYPESNPARQIELVQERMIPNPPGMRIEIVDRDPNKEDTPMGKLNLDSLNLAVEPVPARLMELKEARMDAQGANIPVLDRELNREELSIEEPNLDDAILDEPVPDRRKESVQARDSPGTNIEMVDGEFSPDALMVREAYFNHGSPAEPTQGRQLEFLNERMNAPVENMELIDDELKAEGPLMSERKLTHRTQVEDDFSEPRKPQPPKQKKKSRPPKTPTELRWKGIVEMCPNFTPGITPTYEDQINMLQYIQGLMLPEFESHGSLKWSVFLNTALVHLANEGPEYVSSYYLTPLTQRIRDCVVHDMTMAYEELLERRPGGIYQHVSRPLPFCNFKIKCFSEISLSILHPLVQAPFSQEMELGDVWMNALFWYALQIVTFYFIYMIVYFATGQPVYDSTKISVNEILYIFFFYLVLGSLVIFIFSWMLNCCFSDCYYTSRTIMMVLNAGMMFLVNYPFKYTGFNPFLFFMAPFLFYTLASMLLLWSCGSNVANGKMLWLYTILCVPLTEYWFSDIAFVGSKDALQLMWFFSVAFHLGIVITINHERRFIGVLDSIDHVNKGMYIKLQGYITAALIWLPLLFVVFAFIIFIFCCFAMCCSFCEWTSFFQRHAVRVPVEGSDRVELRLTPDDEIRGQRITDRYGRYMSRNCIFLKNVFKNLFTKEKVNNYKQLWDNHRCCFRMGVGPN